MLDIQQKSGLKKMLLEKKLAALTETLEKTEVQLYAALSVSSQDLTTRSNAAKKLEVRRLHIIIFSPDFYSCRSRTTKDNKPL